jgi:hypothetical protein
VNSLIALAIALAFLVVIPEGDLRLPLPLYFVVPLVCRRLPNFDSRHTARKHCELETLSSNWSAA